MDTISAWLDTRDVPSFPSVDQHLQVDAVVVGAGITGITAAYLLKRAGKTVALLERDRCLNVDTGHTTAHITYVTDARLTDLVQRFGRDHAQAAWDAGSAALHFIRETIALEEIDCDFSTVPGHLHAPVRGQADLTIGEQFEKEARLARDLGFEATFLPQVPLINRPGIRFANQAEFHPVKYLSRLLASIPGNGSHVFEHSSADEFPKHPHGVHGVKSNGHVIACDYIIIATHVPLLGENGLLSGTLFQTKLASYTSYAVGAKVPLGRYPHACFWDTGEPYDYLRINRAGDHDYAILGGEDHKTGQADDTEQRFERLRGRLADFFPDAVIDHQWSGQVVETHDGLPLIGEITDRQFIATGFAGNGITFGTIAALMARDAFLKRKNPWAELFDVHRKKLSAGWDYVKQNLDYPYYLLKDRLKSAEGKSLDDVPAGEGRIIKLNGHRVAAYRDLGGRTSCVSAACTHMGCLVHFNPAEKSWDCPCHGSRFNTEGQVIAGPAETPLKKIDTTSRQKAG